MTMTPQQRDAVLRRAITDRYRKPLRDRLQAAETDLKRMRARMLNLAKELATLHEEASVLAVTIGGMLAELRTSEDTTMQLPTIADPGEG